MSKKSKAQREKRKNKKLRLAERASPSTSPTLADPKVRKASLVNLVRQLPWDLKSHHNSRCGTPPEVTFVLIADPSERFDGAVKQWPVHPEEGVAILVAPGATEKVAITAGVIFPRKVSDVEPGPKSFGQQEN